MMLEVKICGLINQKRVWKEGWFFSGSLRKKIEKKRERETLGSSLNLRGGIRSCSSPKTAPFCED